jgi:aryl-alcohol dehydrogenase-like predicted oxidoreductase
MGTWKTFDVSSPDEEQFRWQIVDAALQAGIRLFDSSPMYGQAERVLGLALSGRRPMAVVATKVWAEDDSAAEQQIQDALRFYDGFVDLYQVHNLVYWEKRVDRLDQLRAEGKIGAIGATHWRAAAYPDLMRAMRTGRLASIQVPYSPWEREIEQDVLPLAGEMGLGILAMRPVGRGQVKTNPPRPEELAPLERFGVNSWADAVLKWGLSEPRITAVIPATQSLDHLRQNAAAGAPPWFGPDEREYVARLATRSTA